VQGYGSSSKTIGKAHSIGPVLKVPTMDQTCKTADLHTLCMQNCGKTVIETERTIGTYLVLTPECGLLLLIQVRKLKITLTISKLSKAELAAA